MADSTSTSSDAAAQRASEQARLRRERREAKLKAGGSARLNKITGLGGRPEEVVPPTTASAPSPAPSADPVAPRPTAREADPDEVDISQHFFAPKTTSRPTVLPQSDSASVPAGGAEPQLSDAALRNMMLGYDPTSGPAGGPNAMMGMPAGAPGAGEEDPMMKMLSQMMGGAGIPGFPPGSGPPGAGASPFPGFPGLQQQQSQPIDRYTALWRLLHSIVALGLGMYIVVLTPFTGTKAEREQYALSDDENQHRKDMFFWVFATAEACLLTTRLFLDKRRAPPAGIVWTVVSYLPEPFKGYLEVALRYGQMLTTVRADILACMFVLGVCAWWRAE